QPEDPREVRHAEDRPRHVGLEVVGPELLADPDVDLVIRGVPRGRRVVAPGRERLVGLELEMVLTVTLQTESGGLHRRVAAFPGEHEQAVGEGVVRHAFDVAVSVDARYWTTAESRSGLECRAPDGI